MSQNAQEMAHKQARFRNQRSVSHCGIKYYLLEVRIYFLILDYPMAWYGSELEEDH